MTIERCEDRIAFALGVDVNVSKLSSPESEVDIAINPTNPLNLAIMANQNSAAEDQYIANSFDGGLTWTKRALGEPQDGIANGSRFDGALEFDAFGNLHATYMAGGGSFAIIYALSSDGGNTFTTTELEPSGSTDKPWIATGPDATNLSNQSVWVTYNDGSDTVIRGASVSGLGTVGAFAAKATVSSITGFAIPAVGPNGEVVVTWQEGVNTENQQDMLFDRDLDGLGTNSTFGTDLVAFTSNVGAFDAIPAQPGRTVFASPYVDYDLSNGPNRGRLYIAYADELVDESNNLDIFVRFSDDNGSTWSSPVKANDDTTTTAAFFQDISVDPVTGLVFVGWYDSRRDLGNNQGADTDGTANNEVEYFATASRDGGLTFDPNIRLADGSSNAARNGDPNEYGDYSGIVAYAGVAHAVWVDNSNSTGDNPDPDTFDIYTDSFFVPIDFAALPDKYTTDEDSVFTSPNSVLDNDFTPDVNATLTVTDIDTTGTQGIVTMNDDGTFTYDPDGLFSDLDPGETAVTTFTYTASDGDETATATVTITITGLPDPNAAPDFGDGFTTDEDTVLTTGNVLANDQAINPGDTLRILSIDTTGLVGTLTDNGDGTFTYDPGDNFQYLQVGLSATTSFSYTVTDDKGGFDRSTVTIKITGLNDAPLAVDDGLDPDTGEPIDGFITSENQRFTTANVLANDVDVDLGDTIRFGFPAPTGNPVNLNNWITGGTGSLNIDTTNTKGIVYDNGDGTFDYDPNGMFEGLADDATATDTFRYIVFDERGAPGIGTVTITIAGANAAPVARAGGPYFVAANQSLTLDASRSRDADIGDVLTYKWDVNGDGRFDENVRGKTVTISPERLASLGVQPGVSVVTVAVGDGIATTNATATLSVGAGPEVSINGPTTGVPGQTLSYRFAAPGDGNVRYEIDWDSDGVVDEAIDGPAAGVFASHVFDTYGPAQISASAFNAANEIVAAGQEALTIKAAVLAGNVLYAGGTADRDLIEFKPGATAGTIVVRVNRESFGPFSQVSQLIGFGLGGNDTLKVDGTVMMPPARLNGGDGNDTILGGQNGDILRGDAGRDLLYGYGGADTLYGGDGDDVLQGQRGNDILHGEGGNDRVNGGDGNDLMRGGVGKDYMIGGLGNDIAVGGDGDDRIAAIEGRDLLIGGLGRDLLDPGAGGGLAIGGSTIYDYNDAALKSILNEWSKSTSLATRAGALFKSSTAASQSSAPYTLEFGVTVRDDGSRDWLADGDDEDWYLAYERDALPALLNGDRVDRA